MSVTLSPQVLSSFCPIPAFHAETPAFYSKVPSLYSQTPYFFADICLFGFYCDSNVHGWVLVWRIQSVSNDDMRVVCGWGGWGHVGSDCFCASVHAKLSWRAICCTNLRPNPEAQSGSWYFRGLGRRDPWIMQEYDLATAISMWLMNHPRMREMGSSIF